MRATFGALVLLLLVSTTASGQSWVLQGSAGPIISDTGHSMAAGIGFSPTSRLTVLFDVERTHVASRFSTDGRGGSSAFRGGTFTLGAGELRFALRGHDRVSPYVLGGFGAGVSRPNVNDIFRDPVTNFGLAVFFGGGIQLPVGERIGVFADARMVVLAERDVPFAVVPARAGVVWRF